MRKVIALCVSLAIIAVAQSQVVNPNTAILSWPAVTTMIDGTPVTGAVSYNVYSYLKTDPSKIYLARQTDQLATTRTNIPPGEWCWYTKSVVGGVESDASPSDCKVIAGPVAKVPSAPASFKAN